MAQEEKGFKPDFENGGFWEYYKDLERQFESFLEYVPYLKDNESTYSFRLANIIVAIGAHIDSALKKIAEDPNFSGKYPEMINPKVKKGKNKGGPRDQELMDYYPISEEYKLYEKVVVFKCLPYRENVSPFKEYQKELGKVPYWWSSYNGIKHNFGNNFKIADIKTIRDALAGAFLLNVIYEPATNRLDKYGLVKDKYPRSCVKENNFFRGKCRQTKFTAIPDYAFDCFIETPLFIYTFDYEKVKDTTL